MTKLLTEKEALMLIKRGILANNTQISVKNNKTNKMMDCYVIKLMRVNSRIMVRAKTMDDSITIVAPIDCVLMIDGQSIESIISAYTDTDEVITITEPTDAANIEGKKLGNIDLEDGMRVILQNDATESLNGKVLNVRIANDGSVKLVGNRGRPRKAQQ